MAMGLDSGTTKISDQFDVTHPIRIASYSIKDFQPRVGMQNIASIFLNSSNIGMVKIAQNMGIERQKHYMKAFGFLDELSIELPEKASPSYPKGKRWDEISMMSMAYGYRYAPTAMHVTQALGAIINGGNLLPATIRKMDANSAHITSEVIRPETAQALQRLLRLNAQYGTAKKAAAPGFVFGGKSGTAHKLVGSSYATNQRLSSMIGAFPMQSPRYVILTMLDNPSPTKETFGFATGGWTAGPVVSRIVTRIGPILGLTPVDETAPEIKGITGDLSKMVELANGAI